MKTLLSRLTKATAFVAVMGFSSFSLANNGIVAIVDDSVILKSDLQQGVELYKKQLEAKGESISNERLLQKRVLDQLILRNAQISLVKRYGIRISDNELNNAMLNIAKKSGANTLEEFQKQVDAKAPNSYARLRASMQEELAIQRLNQQMVMSRIKISDQDVENFLKSPSGQAIVGTQYHVIHARISSSVNNADVKGFAELVRNELKAGKDPAQLKGLSQAGIVIQSNDLGWKELSEIPSELAVRVSPLNKGEVSELIQGLDGSVHLVKVIDRKASAVKNIVPQYKTRHILIQPTAVVSPEVAKQQIERLYQRLNQGEDFTVLASTFSSDSGTARDGGSLGWVNLGTMVPEFEQMMKNTPVGQISQPFKTQYGWHILKVEDTRQYDMTQESQKEMARQVLGDGQLNLEMEDWLREVRSGAYIEIKDPSLRDY